MRLREIERGDGFASRLRINCISLVARMRLPTVEEFERAACFSSGAMHHDLMTRCARTNDRRLYQPPDANGVSPVATPPGPTIIRESVHSFACRK